VFVHDVEGTHEDGYFYSTDPALSASRIITLYTGRWSIETTQADYPSSRRWVGTNRIGYHRRDGVARTGRVVPATPGRTCRRGRLSDTTQRPTPPRA
jgi:hypothetical protein